MFFIFKQFITRKKVQMSSDYTENKGRNKTTTKNTPKIIENTPPDLMQSKNI